MMVKEVYHAKNKFENEWFGILCPSSGFFFFKLSSTIEEQILQNKFGQARFRPPGYQNDMGKNS